VARSSGPGGFIPEPVAIPPDGDGFFLAGLKPAGQRQANRKRLDRMKVPVGNAIDHLARQPRDVKIFDLVGLRVEEVEHVELQALKGPAGEVRHLADHIIAERGVRYGRVVMIPTSKDKKPRKRTHRHP
jgi:NikR C terminal nickel binding domain